MSRIEICHHQLTRDDRSHIDRKHYLLSLKSFFRLEIEQLANGRKDRDGDAANLRVHKYDLSRLPTVGYANGSN